MRSSFRRDLARRILRAVALGAPIASVPSIISCSLPCGGNSSTPITVCFDPRTVDAGAFSRDASAADGCPGFTDLLAVDGVSTVAPFDAGEPFSIRSGPTAEGELCCYGVLDQPCIGGRPYLVGGYPLLAAGHRHDSGWSVAQPDVEETPEELRAELAAAWLRDALFEHASVASFSRFSLELLALGAPRQLVEAAHRAALDEVHHARLCFALAGAYAREPRGPGPMPLAGHVEVSSDLASVAARVASEGCVGETLAAALTGERLARARHPAVRAALEVIAGDEARHAELAWRTVAWTVRTGDARVHAAVAAALVELGEGDHATSTGEGGREDFGWLAGEEARRVTRRAMRDIVRPATRVVLDARTRHRRLAA